MTCQELELRGKLTSTQWSVSDLDIRHQDTNGLTWNLGPDVHSELGTPELKPPTIHSHSFRFSSRASPDRKYGPLASKGRPCCPEGWPAEVDGKTQMHMTISPGVTVVGHADKGDSRIDLAKPLCG